MKAIMVVFIGLLIGCIVACTRNTEPNNIELTDFTKELISFYIDDPLNSDAKIRNDEIIIISYSDSLFYYLSIFANNSKSYKFCRDDLVGRALHLGHLIRVFGDENNMFYFVIEKIKSQNKCNKKYAEFDPNVWRLRFHKDQLFCKMGTMKTAPEYDLSAIQNLVEKYFETSEIIDNDIFQSHEVANGPKFILGEDSLRHLLSSNFSVRKEGNFGKIPIVVGVLVDKSGKAVLNGIMKTSNDKELDNEALRVAKIVCSYDFIPASHRGEVVNVIFPIVFFSDDILP